MSDTARVAEPEFPFDPPLPAPTPSGGCRSCGRPLVIVGHEPHQPGQLEVVGMPQFRWAHADDLTIDCVRVLNDPVRPYSAWMRQADQDAIHAELNRRYDAREDSTT